MSGEAPRFREAREPHPYDAAEAQLRPLADTIRELGLKRWLAAVVGPDSARKMIRDAWVSLDRDDRET